MQKPVMYLASPYTHPNKEIMHLRYLATRETTAELLRDGKPVYSPIVHCHSMTVAHGLSPDIEFWEDYDFAMIAALPIFAVLELPGWSSSKGIKAEIAFADSLGKTSKMISPVGTYTAALDQLAVAGLYA